LTIFINKRIYSLACQELVIALYPVMSKLETCLVMRQYLPCCSPSRLECASITALLIIHWSWTV